MLVDGGGERKAHSDPSIGKDVNADLWLRDGDTVSYVLRHYFHLIDFALSAVLGLYVTRAFIFSALRINHLWQYFADVIACADICYEMEEYSCIIC